MRDKNLIYIYIYNKNNNIYHIRQNSAQCTKKQTCYSEGSTIALRNFAFCKISQAVAKFCKPAKICKLRNFLGELLL